ncbi:MAG: aminotransferase class I/II-fold pyridoxal phosphate-dependent enzyme [Anaerolineae bacterium]|nr:aminotransferase class I/II-fold pyridoxal phosphate-dependent enzyme [Thermoflexus sp.]MDW8065401.1 aminotransferase class I/II-fold pyridoxal phosphate-dependent enzyme [Anaerolineae bacterium]
MRSRVAQRVASIPSSGIRRFFDVAATMKDVISLSIGEPDFVTPGPILRAGVESMLRGETHYTSNSGLLELRQALAEHLYRLYGISYDPEHELLITVGVSEALYLAVNAVIDPGDEVIIPQPCFVSYAPEVLLASGIPVVFATREEEDFQVNPADIEARITPRTKAILLGYPNNPTGAVMPYEKLAAIAALAEKYDLLVISDEIYDRLVYDGSHVCFASLPGAKKRTILLGGFSKNYAMTGWRIGYAAAPRELMAAMHKIHQYTIMSAPTPSQHAALAALRIGEEYVEQMRQEYDRRRRLIVKGLNELGLTCFEPKGAFYAFPSIARTGMGDEEFSERLLLEEKVAVVPGSVFGLGGRGHVRCSYATAYEKIEEALERIARFMRRYG